MRFIRLSSRLQMRVAAGVVGLGLFWLLSMAGMAVWNIVSAPNNAELLARQARIEHSESRVAAYRKNVDGVASDLARRQDFIEKMVQAHLGDLPKDARAGETVSDSGQEAAKAVHKISAAVPEAAGLARMEARQLAFVESLTRYADRRAGEDAARMRRLGVNPDVMLAALDRGGAQGGPLIALFTGANGGIDPRFARMGASLARMSALQQGLSRLPQVLPANLQFLSSGFGYRADPFTRRGSFHPGLDFRGPVGAPIFAAARGMVSFAGRKAGYGNCVEVTHINGIITRYAHMSAIRARVGQNVTPGQTIGAIGSTGRSTGPHLHFEVRVNDRPINPRPFLEAISHVSEKDLNRPAPGND
jgi:murein DD-endopeptidase MepM/ murein hydrolase activator NlpD